MRGRYDVEVCDACGETVGDKHAINKAAECRHTHTRKHVETALVGIMMFGMLVISFVAYAVGHSTRSRDANVPVIRCEAGVIVARTDRGETARCVTTSR